MAINPLTESDRVIERIGMNCLAVIDEINHVAENAISEMELKAAYMNLNALESDLIYMGLMENLSTEILSIRLKIQERLGWFITH